MKTLAAALITALLVFSLATAWIDFVQPRLDLIAQASTSKATAGSAKSSNKRSPRRTAIDETDDDEELVDEPIPKAVSKPVRIRKRPYDEQVVSDATRERLLVQLADVKQKESKLVAREETLRMVYEDIRSELAAVEDIRRQSATELALAERRLLDTALNKTNAATSGSGVNEAVNATKPKATAEARIASVIQDLASQGNVAAAAGLLSGMKDREVAKVLTSLSARDPRLALRLSDQVQSAKQESLRR